MPKYVALLRAINVGGHNVKMAHLRRLFGEMGFVDVETYIASGNVIFAAPEGDAGALERRIEESLEAALGYPVATFLRTPPELAAIAAYDPFESTELAAHGHSLYVSFVAQPPTGEGIEQLLAHTSAVDEFHVAGREVYWLCRVKSSESNFSGARLEKALGAAATMRNITTVRKLAAKYA
ncbi:MAG: DUF1697 domain-containing protein [Anaerolineae bacterium]